VVDQNFLRGRTWNVLCWRLWTDYCEDSLLSESKLIFSKQRQEVPEGQSLLVNNSLFFAAHEDTSKSSELSILGGCWTCMWGGEGFVMKFRGPCVVYTQSRDPTIMNKLVFAKMQRKQNRNSKKSGGGAPPAQG
jgi:hypothetical protein